MKQIKSILPFYFGPSEKPLFGCYHEPSAGASGRCAVLICQPVGHEYINSHRALRQLAVRLCDAGFPVLRFDYYGCGDSSGNSEEGRVPQWLEDISTAISELRRRTGLTQVCVIGLRLGGTLSAMTGAWQGSIDSLVLWDPVVNGEKYLGELLSLQKEMSRFRPKPKRNRKSQGHADILGFPLSNFLRSELENTNLLTVTGKPAKNVLVIQSDQISGENRLNDHLHSTGVRLEYQRLEAPQIWLPVPDGSLLVPNQVLQTIVSWTCRMHP